MLLWVSSNNWAVLGYMSYESDCNNYTHFQLLWLEKIFIVVNFKTAHDTIYNLTLIATLMLRGTDKYGFCGANRIC